MFKFLVFATIIFTVNAGLILDHKPAVIVAHGATSHQNSNSLSIHPVPVVAHRTVAVHAPIAVAHAPIAVAHAPIVAHAPVAVVHAPAVSHAAVVHHPAAFGIHH